MTKKADSGEVENLATVRTLADLPLLGGSSRRVEEDERLGTEQLAKSDLIPAQGPRAELEAMGFVFGAPKMGDDLFVHAVFPKGWAWQTTEHAMWNYIVDETGKRRVAVFYKAAFYDRRAHFHVERDREE